MDKFDGHNLIEEGYFFYSFKLYYKTPKCIGETPSQTLEFLD